jgi:hypothetical protein
MTHPRRCARIALLAAAALVVPPLPVGWAQPGEPASRPATTRPAAAADVPGVKRMIARLAADGFRDREAARVELMGLPRAKLPVLREAVKQMLPLEASQLSVLRDIVAHVYLAGETYDVDEGAPGFLGISLPPFMRFPGAGGAFVGGRGVEVMARVPGFCAYRMLQDGDVILALTVPGSPAVELNSSDELIEAVRAVKGGQTITLEVLRQGEVLSVPITLDPRPRIPATGPLEEFKNRRAMDADAHWERDFAPLLGESFG